MCVRVNVCVRSRGSQRTRKTQEAHIMAQLVGKAIMTSKTKTRALRTLMSNKRSANRSRVNEKGMIGTWNAREQNTERRW